MKLPHRLTRLLSGAEPHPAPAPDRRLRDPVTGARHRLRDGDRVLIPGQVRTADLLRGATAAAGEPPVWWDLLPDTGPGTGNDTAPGAAAGDETQILPILRSPRTPSYLPPIRGKGSPPSTRDPHPIPDFER